MRVIKEPTEATMDVPDADALITEARQRQRKRWLVIGIVVLMAIIVSGVSYALVSRPSARARHTRTLSPTKTVSATQSGSYVSPKAPTTLAVAPNGDLLVVDSGRDQILRYLPSGKFQVVAGDGKRGFSGDGGPAVRAEIDDPSGIAAAKNGTVYFSDTGNGRVREILPDGIIETVAGGGTLPLGTKVVPALRANFLTPWGLFGLAIGPNGQLYIGTNGVYRLGRDGMLHWVVGEVVKPPRTWGGVFSNPAIQSDFIPAVRLAFDGKGDLLVAGGPAFGLYEMTRTGKLRFVSHFRGDGYWGSMAEDAEGTVVASLRNGICRILASGTCEPIGPPPMAGFSPFDAALGKGNIFIGGTGVAVSKDGVIYVDTNPGNTFTSVSAILDLRPNGSVVALWKS
jgi:hypothetical protein